MFAFRLGERRQNNFKLLYVASVFFVFFSSPGEDCTALPLQFLRGSGGLLGAGVLVFLVWGLVRVHEYVSIASLGHVGPFFVEIP